MAVHPSFFASPRQTGDVGANSESEGCPLTKKIPMVKPCQNVELFNQLTMRRQALIWCVDTLWHRPDVRLECKMWLECRLSAAAANEKGVNGSVALWPSTYVHLNKLPKYWMVGWMLKHADSEWTAADFEMIEAHDAEGPRQIFYFVNHCNDQDWLPRAALDKEVTTLMFDKRYSSCGNRLRPLKARLMNGNGQLNWSRGGAYQLEWNAENTRATQVRHVSGDRADVPEHVHITPAYTLRDGWSDNDASVKLGVATYVLADFFAATKRGPFLTRLDKKSTQLKVIAEAIVKERAESVVAPMQVDPTFGSAAKDEKRKAALEVARARAREKKARLRRGVPLDADAIDALLAEKQGLLPALADGAFEQGGQ